jgi:uncharacterized protein (TIGR03437 family)
MLHRANLTVLALAACLFLSSNTCQYTFGQGALLNQAISECLQLPLSPTTPIPPPYTPGGAGRFEANHGQADDRYPLLGRGPGYFLYLNAHETILDLRPAQRVIRLTLDGAAAGAPLLEPEGEVNYFLGAEPSAWLTNVPTYREVGYRGVYPGVDLVYYRKDGHLEHDFRLAAGADPARIRWRFSGVDRVTPDGEGLLLVAGAARMRWHAPLALQGTRRIPVRYQIHPDGAVGFALGAYDRTQPLVIDPVMEYLTYLGQRGGEVAGRSTVDPQGNIILTGATTDPVYPVTPGAPLTNPQGFRPANILISKFDPTGTRLLASTYIGGGDAEMAAAVSTDAAGNLYVTGATNSPDWPTTANAFQRRPATMEPGKTDPGNCFVVKLNPSASALLYSTFLSGNQTDGCIALAVDAAGHAYVTGGSDSPNFPTSPGAYQARPRLGSAQVRYDVFVAKLVADGSALSYSTFVGGSGSETGHGIAIDAAGHAYVTGVTNSPNFPTTAGALRSTLAGSGGSPLFYPIGDAFAFKLNPTGSELLYSTYLGGARDDSGLAIAVDSSGSAYIAGNTLSRDFPVTTGALQRDWRGEGGNAGLPAGDAFVAKLNPAGTALVYSTLLGGARDDRAVSLALGTGNTLHIAGHTLSTDFPVSADAAQATQRSTNLTAPLQTGDGFYAHLNAEGNRLLYSTYLGGADNDWLSGIAVAPSGAVVVTGNTTSANLAVSANAFQRTFFGGDAQWNPAGDLLIARFNNPPAIAYANAASYATGAVAPRLITTLVGTGFTAQSRFVFDGVPAEVLYSTPTQAAVVVPAGVRNPTTLVVDNQPPVVIPVVPAQPALFTANASGSGPGAILNQDSSLNTAANAARPGEIVVLYGTGDGPGPVQATVAGRPAEVLYAGPSAGLTIGLVQVNIRVPAETPAGAQPVTIRVGAASSQSGVTVAIRE